MSTSSEEKIQERLRTFENVYSKLNKNMDKYNKFQPWLLMVLKNQYQDGSTYDSIRIDTFTSSATINIPGKASYKISPIMLTNFEYNKNGSAQANTFSISFAYNPAEKNDSGGKILDPMIIDKALTVSSWYKEDETGSYKAIDSIAKHKCYMKYGYAYGEGDFIESPEYYGQALKANSELRDGMIYYTITGYSSLTYVADITLDVKAIGTKKEDGTVENGKRASVIMCNALYSCFHNENTENAVELNIEGFDVDPDIQKAFSDSSKSISEAMGTLYKGIKVNIVNQVTDSMEDEIAITSSESGSVYDYLSKVGGSAELKGNKNHNEDKKLKLTYKIEELDKELNFIIYIEDPGINSGNGAEAVEDYNEKMKLKTNVVYQYPLQSNNIVQSFTPDFNFEVIWSKDIFLGENGEGESQYITADNEVKSYKDSKFTSLVGSGAEMRSMTTFSDAIQYAYKADLTTAGIPADIPIGTIINVKPIINGIEYHYSGDYMVLKTTDRIDTNGYTTEYDLFKLVPVKSKADETLEKEKAEAKNQIKTQKQKDQETVQRMTTAERKAKYSESSLMENLSTICKQKGEDGMKYGVSAGTTNGNTYNRPVQSSSSDLTFTFTDSISGKTFNSPSEYFKYYGYDVSFKKKPEIQLQPANKK